MYTCPVGCAGVDVCGVCVRVYVRLRQGGCLCVCVWTFIRARFILCSWERQTARVCPCETDSACVFTWDRLDEFAHIYVSFAYTYVSFAYTYVSFANTYVSFAYTYVSFAYPPAILRSLWSLPSTTQASLLRICISLLRIYVSLLHTHRSLLHIHLPSFRALSPRRTHNAALCGINVSFQHIHVSFAYIHVPFSHIHVSFAYT